VIDPGHGGVDNGTKAGGGENNERIWCMGFGLALRDRIEKSGKYRVVMTREDDTFVPTRRPCQDRSQSVGGAVCVRSMPTPCRVARVTLRAPRSTRLSDRASDSEAERLAETEKQG